MSDFPDPHPTRYPLQAEGYIALYDLGDRALFVNAGGDQIRVTRFADGTSLHVWRASESELVRREFSHA